MDLVKSIKSAFKKVTGESQAGRYWDMSDVDNREATVLEDYTYSQAVRSPQQKKWMEYDKYYNNEHIVMQELYKTLSDNNVPFIPAIVPLPFIHVESQIIPDAPDFQFNGRDNDLDSQRAKQREYVVQSILDENKIAPMVTRNERRLNKLGNAFWKVSFDGSIVDGNTIGKIIIGDPDPANIFPDPSAIDVDDCEFIIYAYRLHRRAAARKFAKQLADKGIQISDISADGKQGDTQIYKNQARDMFDDTVQVIEYWFKQNEYGSESKESEFTDSLGNKQKSKRKIEWEPGDIACSIQINNKEIQYIPKYWEKTGQQNKQYPFVKYCKIPNENSFWDKSDIEMITPLTDQADRELATTILNDTFMANDVTVVENGALMEDSEINTTPGAIIKVRDGKINAIRRLGGIANPTNRLEIMNFITDLVQKVVGNFDTSMGNEPVRVTTASGIAQLNERADARKNIKKADRLAGFERLYELLDWTALEFYDDNRLIFIGAVDEKAKAAGQQMAMMAQNGQQVQNMNPQNGPIIFKFNSDNFKLNNGQDSYYPRIDCTVNAGDGLSKSKAFTLSATENLLKTPVTPANYKIVEEMLDIMDLPNKNDIKEFFDKLYANPQPQQDKPNVSIGFKDLPADAQIQILQQMGIQSQGGISPSLQAELQEKQNEKQQQVQQQTDKPITVEDATKGMSQEDLQFLQQNPQQVMEILKQQNPDVHQMLIGGQNG